MADAIVSIVVERVASIIQDQIRYGVNLAGGMEMALLELSNMLSTIKNMNELHMRQADDQRVKNWLKKLQNMAYEIDDILDECNYSLREHNMEASVEPEIEVGCSSIPSSCLCFKKAYVRRDILMKTQNVKVKLDHVLKESNDFNLSISQPATDHMRESWKFQSMPYIEQEKVHGVDIDSKKREIVRKLVLSSGDTQILSIVGMMGIGKTTLAQHIYNDSQLTEDIFDLKIWVCVSNNFDVASVATKIVADVTRDFSALSTYPVYTLIQKLRDCISGKKFLLVLDDVWTSEWEFLKTFLSFGALGSKILVTTTNESVAKTLGTLDDDIYHLGELSDEECWLILRDKSLIGKSEEECEVFKVVGIKIARKCKGLPLAANVFGGLLRFKTSLLDWEYVEKSEKWQLEIAKSDMFPRFVLSYNKLSLAHKRCFSYCAAYPKDSRYHAESLIEEWMTLGYLGYSSGDSEVERKGRDCLDNLAMCWSLFQDIKKSESGGEIEWCKMHDIFHDFALFLWEDNEDAEMRNRSCEVCDPLSIFQAQEHRSLIWEKIIPLHLCDCVTSVRILKVENGLPPVGLERLIHLRLLEFSGMALSKDVLKIICRFYFLQTLSLARCNIFEISREIGNLVHLRRLDLSGNEELKELPQSMYSLVELRTLSLAYCSLKEIPREIGNLVELRRLDLSWNEKLKELPESMYNLVELRTLSLAYCSVEEIHEEIRNLVQLRNLDLSGNVLLKELPKSMGCLVELRTLSLAYCSLKEIGREIGNLIRLKQLDLRWNRELKELPVSIHKLVELQILKIEGTKVHHSLPEAVGQLSNLTLELRELKVGGHYNRLGLLKKVKDSTGSLTLDISFSTMSEMLELVKDAREAQLKILFQELEKLKISFEGTMNGNEPSSSSSPSPSSMWMMLLDALEPQHELKQLKIWGYEGSTLPSWMSSPNKFIQEISLHYLSEVSSLPALGKLPFLEVLYIDHLKEVKQVGREFLGIESASDDDVVAFPKLKELSFDTCPKWEEWEDITEEEEESAAISIMPCLTVLSIISCKSLKKLPHRLLHKASSSLQMLDIEESSELVATYREDKEGSPWRSISQHNPQLFRYL